VANSVTSGKKDWLYAVFSKDVFLGEGVKSVFYRPLLNLSFAADGLFRPDGFFVFHLTNVLLHALFCVILFFFLTEFGIRDKYALAGSFLFAVLPYNAWAVAWLPGRNDILLSIFALLAVLAAVRWTTGRRGIYIFLFFVFFLLSLFTKETAAAVPAVVFAALYLKKGKAVSKDIAFTAALILPACCFYFLCRAKADILPGSLSMITFRNLLYLPFFFFSYLFGAARINFTNVFLSYILFILSFSFFFIKSGDKKLALFCIVWFFCFFIPPLLNISVFIGDFYLPHRLYLPMAGLILAVCAFFQDMSDKKEKFKCALFIISAFSLYLMNVADSARFRDQDCFVQYLDSKDYLPNSGMNYAYMGIYYFNKGLYRLSEIYLDKALDRGFTGNGTRVYLACIYLASGRASGGAGLLEEEIRENPDSALVKALPDDIKERAGIKAVRRA